MKLAYIRGRKRPPKNELKKIKIISKIRYTTADISFFFYGRCRESRQLNLKYTIRLAGKIDFELSYDIKRTALQKYIELTRGWDNKWQFEYHRKDFDPTILHFIEANNNIIGMYELIEKKTVVTISELFIIDGYQSRGIGSDIIKKLIDTHSQKKIKIHLLKSNNRVNEFYERLGFDMFCETKNQLHLVYRKRTNKQNESFVMDALVENS